MRRVLKTPAGMARISQPDARCVRIDADSTEAAIYAQGYATGWLRAWQLDLTRRVAAGRLSALFGARTVRRDRLQRRLGLCALAWRDVIRDRRTRQGRLVGAYVAGIRQAWTDRRLPALEFVLLGQRPAPFTRLDVYRTAHLKYFINTTWRFELLFTLICGQIGAKQAARLFSIETEGAPIGPFDDRLLGCTDAIESVLADARDAMGLLGLEAPDIGSNVVAVGAHRSRRGAPLLANDPHMGQVVPAFSMLCHLHTADGLDVRGAHFPGTPGIFIGRTAHHAWGMAGVMADNQDVFWGRMRGRPGRREVQVAGQWRRLRTRHESIGVRGQQGDRLDAYDLPPTQMAGGATAAGRLIFENGDHGLFLRWPALERSCGDIVLEDLARADGLQSFRAALAGMRNTPVVAAYADSRQIGLQMAGDIPQRRAPVGSLVQSLARAAHQWTGYVPSSRMPSRTGTPDEVLIHANQHDPLLLAGSPHIGLRWHPPTRARRLAELTVNPVDADDLMRAQDDRIDGFARDSLPGWLAQLEPDLALEARRRFGDWQGDTRCLAPTTLFERWCCRLAAQCTGDLPASWASAWLDEWPAWRWAVRRMATPGALNQAFFQALAESPQPQVEFRHALRRHPLGRNLGQRIAFAGGSRETVHVARRSLDFLTAGQSPGARPTPYCFGPAFKLVCDMAPGGSTWVGSPLPARGRPIGPTIRRTLRQWRRGERWVW